MLKGGKKEGSLMLVRDKIVSMTSLEKSGSSMLILTVLYHREVNVQRKSHLYGPKTLIVIPSIFYAILK